MNKFTDLKPGDMVTLSLRGTFKVKDNPVSKHWVELENLDGYDNWSFDFGDDESHSWDIKIVGGQLTTKEENASGKS